MSDAFRALLIGVPYYTDPDIDDLPFVENDLNEVAQALRGVGYTVEQHPVEQTDLSAIDTAVERFLREAGPGQTVLLFLSGHGIHHDGTDYLVPSGADTQSNNFPGRCQPIDFGTHVQHSAAAEVVVVIDACREGIHLHDKGGINITSWSAREIAQASVRRIAYVYACSPGQRARYAGTGPTGFSLFSRAFSQVLGSCGAALTLAMLERDITPVLDGLSRVNGLRAQHVRVLTDASRTEFFVARRSVAVDPPAALAGRKVTVKDIASLAHRAGVRSVAFSADGGLLVTGGHEAKVNIWTTDRPGSPEYVRPIRYGRGLRILNSVLATDFCNRGRILAAGGNDGVVRIWDLSKPWDPVRTAVLADHEDVVSAVSFAPAGQLLATGSHDGSAIVWTARDPTRPGRSARLRRHEGAVNTVRFSPGGHVLATGSADTSVILWDLADPSSPRPVQRLTGHADAVRSLAFSCDGRLLVTGGVDSNLIVWDVADPTRPARQCTVACESPILALDLHPLDLLLATGHSDGHVVLWDVTDPTRPVAVTTMSLHSHRVRSVRFAPDGRTLASGSRDKSVLLWDVDSV